MSSYFGVIFTPQHCCLLLAVDVVLDAL